MSCVEPRRSALPHLATLRGHAYRANDVGHRSEVPLCAACLLGAYRQYACAAAGCATQLASLRDALVGRPGCLFRPTRMNTPVGQRPAATSVGREDARIGAASRRSRDADALVRRRDDEGSGGIDPASDIGVAMARRCCTYLPPVVAVGVCEADYCTRSRPQLVNDDHTGHPSAGVMRMMGRAQPPLDAAQRR
jgi:hypothetical protein